jgi:lipid A 3-O-deacylase
MRNKSVRWWVILTLTCLFAQAGLATTGVWSVQWDNDVWGGAKQDQGYTNGLVVRRWADETTSFQPLTLGLESAPTSTWWAGGQQLFTPHRDEALVTTSVLGDQPYAAWLFVQRGVVASDGDEWRSSSWTLGHVGPASLGEVTQNNVHRWLGKRRFKGWDQQLASEWTLQWDHERWSSLARRERWSWDHGWQLSLGTPRTRMSALTEVRWGDDITTLSSLPMRSRGWQAWARFSSTWVGRDLFLDGLTWEDSQRVDSRRWVGMASTGVRWTGQRWTIGFARHWQTRQFHGQRERPVYGSWWFERSF